MALTAYFDESGTHDEARVFALAGVVGACDEWDSFEQDWNQLLHDSKITASHMREMESFLNEFENWQPKDKISFMQSAIAIINKKRLGRIGCSVDMKDYKDLIRGPVKTVMGSEGLIAFGFCIHLIAEWVRRNETDNEVDFIFEISEFSGQIEDYYSMLCKHPAIKAHLRIGNIAFKSKQESVHLQASDLIAYEIYKGFDNMLAGWPRQPRKSLIALESGTKTWGYHVERPTLQLYADYVYGRLAGGPQIDLYSLLGIEGNRN